MALEYLLIADGEEIHTTGNYVPREGETVQISGHPKSTGVYTVYTVVNHVNPDHQLGETVYFKAGLPRVMLLNNKK